MRTTPVVRHHHTFAAMAVFLRNQPRPEFHRAVAVAPVRVCFCPPRRLFFLRKLPVRTLLVRTLLVRTLTGSVFLPRKCYRQKTFEILSDVSAD